VFKYSEDPDH